MVIPWRMLNWPYDSPLYNSYTFNIVQENTDAYWKYHRYELIREYIKKPVLVPPFIVFSHVYRLCKHFCTKDKADNELGLLHVTLHFYAVPFWNMNCKDWNPEKKVSGDHHSLKVTVKLNYVLRIINKWGGGGGGVEKERECSSLPV